MIASGLKWVLYLAVATAIAGTLFFLFFFGQNGEWEFPWRPW